jgi:hypothetical protein
MTIGGFKAALLGSASFVTPTTDGFATVKGIQTEIENTDQLTIDIQPTATITDDLVLLYFLGETGHVHSVPPGYTSIETSHNGSPGTSSMFWKLAVGVEGSVTLTSDTVGKMLAICLVIRDVDTTTPIEGTNTSTTDSTSTRFRSHTPRLDMTTEQDCLMVGYGVVAKGNTNHTVGFGFTEHADVGTGDSSGLNAVAFSRRILARTTIALQTTVNTGLQVNMGSAVLIRSKTPSANGLQPYIIGVSSVSTTFGSSINITPHADTLDDDLVIIMFGNNDTQANTLPSGWTHTMPTETQGIYSVSLFSKVISGDAATAVNCAIAAGFSNLSAVAITIRRPTSGTPVIDVLGAVSKADGTIPVAPSITAGFDNSLLLTGLYLGDSEKRTWLDARSLKVADENLYRGGNVMQCTFGAEVFPANGATGTRTHEIETTRDYVTFLMSIKP